jgi:hypothetical protein
VSPVVLDEAVDLGQLENACARTEQLRQEAADAERSAYLRWQEAFAAYEVARDEASDAWTAWAEAIGP